MAYIVISVMVIFGIMSMNFFFFFEIDWESDLKGTASNINYHNINFIPFQNNFLSPTTFTKILSKKYPFSGNPGGYSELLPQVVDLVIFF